MKNARKCPKCQSSEILRIPHAGPGEMRSWIAAGWLYRPVELRRYVCASCGFSEEWIDDAKGIARIKRRFGSDLA
jgi:predicted nucleic-acid-binding Zn-ribbon protein